MPTVVKTKKKTTEPTNLSDDELRRRIYGKSAANGCAMSRVTNEEAANAAVLFPSSSTQNNAYEIVYGTRPRPPSKETPGVEENPFQYAMLVRRTPTGEFTPLMKGQAWSTDKPWSMALQGLLDVTASAIHKKLGSREMPPLGISEELPTYSANLNRTVTQ